MKSTHTQNPLADQILNDEEQMLEQAFERGEFEEVSTSELEETKKMLKESAQQYRELHNSKPVTIRVNQLDLIRIKAKAQRKQIPYQTLLGLLIHDYVEEDREISI